MAYTRYFTNATYESDQESFLIWLFKNGIDGDESLRNLCRDLICIFIGVSEKLASEIRIIDCERQVTKKPYKGIIDILIEFEFNDEKSILALEHKVKNKVNNPFQAYKDYVEGNYKKFKHYYAVLNPFGFSNDEEDKIKKYNEEYKMNIIIVKANNYISLLKKYIDKDNVNMYLLNDYYCSYFIDESRKVSELSRVFSKCKNIFLNEELHGFIPSFKSKIINFKKNNAEFEWIMKKWASGDYYLNIKSEKLIKSELIIGVTDKPRTRFKHKDYPKVETLKDIKELCIKCCKEFSEILEKE